MKFTAMPEPPPDFIENRAEAKFTWTMPRREKGRLKTNRNMAEKGITKSIDYEALLRQTVAVLPWGHNLLLMNKELSDEQTIFYAQEVIVKGWSCGMFKKLYICRKHRHTFLYGSSRS